MVIKTCSLKKSPHWLLVDLHLYLYVYLHKFCAYKIFSEWKPWTTARMQVRKNSYWIWSNFNKHLLINLLHSNDEGGKKAGRSLLGPEGWNPFPGQGSYVCDLETHGWKLIHLFQGSDLILALPRSPSWEKDNGTAVLLIPLDLLLPFLLVKLSKLRWFKQFHLDLDHCLQKIVLGDFCSTSGHLYGIFKELLFLRDMLSTCPGHPLGECPSSHDNIQPAASRWAIWGTAEGSHKHQYRKQFPCLLFIVSGA